MAVADGSAKGLHSHPIVGGVGRTAGVGQTFVARACKLGGKAGIERVDYAGMVRYSLCVSGFNVANGSGFSVDDCARVFCYCYCWRAVAVCFAGAERGGRNDCTC